MQSDHLSALQLPHSGLVVLLLDLLAPPEFSRLLAPSESVALPKYPLVPVAPQVVLVGLVESVVLQAASFRAPVPEANLALAPTLELVPTSELAQALVLVLGLSEASC